jgi:hypothetical protein
MEQPSTSLLGFPRWGWMWLVLFGLYAAAKAEALWRVWRLESGPFARVDQGTVRARWGSFLWAAAFIFLWPGLNAADFGPGGRRTARTSEWAGVFAGLGKMGLGAVLLWIAARHVGHPLLAGWVGMVGLVFLLHFGLLHLTVLGWRLGGLDVDPIMRWPIAAGSVADFWGRRWNRPFNELTRRLCLRPLSRRWGLAAATAAAFLFSGLLHELVISFPAGAGWGFPTGYFLIQGTALLAERRWRLSGHLWTWLAVAGPAFWLFHPPFVTRVMLPFFAAIGALPIADHLIHP